MFCSTQITLENVLLFTSEVASAAQQTNALELESPALVGTVPSTITSIPVNARTQHTATICSCGLGICRSRSIKNETTPLLVWVCATPQAAAIPTAVLWVLDFWSLTHEKQM